MCEWVISMDLYAQAFRDVEPRRLALRVAEEKLEKKTEELKTARAELEEVTQKVGRLQERYDASEEEKNVLIKEVTIARAIPARRPHADHLRMRVQTKEVGVKLARAGKIVDGLSGERSRWCAARLMRAR
jgi:dynein heavy chain